jgi:hypothetical protein
MSLTPTIITKELIELLDRTFPDKCPRGSMTLESLRFIQGQRSLIEYIHSIYNEERNITPE